MEVRRRQAPPMHRRPRCLINMRRRRLRPLMETRRLASPVTRRSTRRRFNRLRHIPTSIQIRRKCASKPFLRLRRQREQPCPLPRRPRRPGARRPRIRNNWPSNLRWAPAPPPRGQHEMLPCHWRACSRDNDRYSPRLSCMRFSRRHFASERDWAWATGYNECIANALLTAIPVHGSLDIEAYADRKRKSIPSLPRMMGGYVVKIACFLIKRAVSTAFL
jgi:hypothetical protein